jgi:MATE family multidrug resistance protein
MAEATTIRIGYHIGAGNVDDAKKVLVLSAIVNSVFGIIAATVGYSFRYQIAVLLTNDPLVIEKSADLAAMLWSSYFLYAIGATGLAVLEGQGKSIEYAILQTIGQWCVTVPLSFISFFFTNWNLQGIWFAMVCGYSVTNILAMSLLYFDTDWNKIVETARVRQYQEVAETTQDEN